jgi:outer membrane protein, multidrug efflux system
MSKTKTLLCIGIACLSLLSASGCVPALQEEKKSDVKQLLPASYGGADEQASSSGLARWDKFFNDPHLTSLINLAIQNNQELRILEQEIRIADNEVMARRGEYMPKAGVGVNAGVDARGENARESQIHGAESKIGPVEMDLSLGFSASWEVDIWKKLRNATKSAAFIYMASIEGRNFAVTNLVAEIARSYYELLALDNQLKVIRSNIEIQQNALEVTRLQKEAAKVTELAVQRFEAEVLKNQSLQYEVLQDIIEVENRINFLVGRYPQPIERSSDGFIELTPTAMKTGVPTQILENRPDVRQAELQLRAAELDIQVARATFYPSLTIDAEVGYRASSPTKLFVTPDALLMGAVASLFTPLINRNAIKANYFSANSKQIQAVYNYERTVLGAYIECANQLAMIDNLAKSYDLKSKQVDKLNEAINISTTLFMSARADYLEVLTTRREALESQLELVETKKRQMLAVVNMYRALGGGWRQ